MTDIELLTKVKSALAISGSYHDDMIDLYINEIKEFLKNAGVSEETLQSSRVVGICARGVADLWNYGAGEGKLSEYFFQRASQLVYASQEVQSDSDYNVLKNKPQINSVELIGDKSLDDIGINELSDEEIEAITSNSI